MPKIKQPTIGIDFEGVMVRHFADDGDWPEPNVGLMDFLLMLSRRNFRVTVYSSRITSAVQLWIDQHGFKDLIHKITYKQTRVGIRIVGQGNIVFTGNFVDTGIAVTREWEGW